MLRHLLVLLLLLVPAPAIHAASIPAYVPAWVEPLGFNKLILPVHAEQRSSPLISGNRVFIGTRLGHVRAHDALSGKGEWFAEVGAPVEADLYRNGQVLYAGTTSGSVHALLADTGESLWRYSAGHEILGRMLVHGGRLIFSTANNQLVAIDAAQGHWLWQYSEGPDPDLSIRGVAGSALVDNTLYTGFSNGFVAAIDASTGKAVWRMRLQPQTQQRFADVDSTPLVLGNMVVVAGYADEVWALERSTGKVIWRSPVSTHGRLTRWKNQLLAAGLDGKIYALDADTGEILWSVKLGRTSLAPVVVQNGRAATGDGEGNLWLIDLAERKPLWSYRGAVTGIHSSPVFGKDGSLYAVSNLGNLFRFRPVR